MAVYVTPYNQVNVTMEFITVFKKDNIDIIPFLRYQSAACINI